MPPKGGKTLRQPKSTYAKGAKTLGRPDPKKYQHSKR